MTRHRPKEISNVDNTKLLELEILSEESNAIHVKLLG
jgi:hypothetical protein